jgi:hypothetical protein
VCSRANESDLSISTIRQRRRPEQKYYAARPNRCTLIARCQHAMASECSFGSKSTMLSRGCINELARLRQILFLWPTLSRRRPQMSSTSASVEAVAAIVFGLLQLAIGIISLWQQRQLHRVYRKRYMSLNRMSVLTKWNKAAMDEDIQSDRAGVAMFHKPEVAGGYRRYAMGFGSGGCTDIAEVMARLTKLKRLTLDILKNGTRRSTRRAKMSCIATKNRTCQ